jgi:phage I-like protein
MLSAQTAKVVRLGLNENFKTGAISRLQIVPPGKHPHRLGMQVIDRSTATRLVKALHRRTRDIVIDYGHASMETPDENRGIAAGWILPRSAFVDSEGGITADVRWTSKASHYIRNGEYRFLSPVFMFDENRSADGELFLTSIINAGLTNNPNIEKMRPIANSKKENNKMNLHEELAKLLALPPSVTEEEILTAIKELTDKAEKSGSAKKEADKLKTELAQNSHEFSELETKVRKFEEKERNELVDNAVATGRVTPAQREWALEYAMNDIDGFTRYLANTNAVPLSHTPEPYRNGGHIDKDQEEILSMFRSITPEDFLSV